MDDGVDFGEKLDLALKLLNISRGTLASEARADKSLVSRWVRGLTAPRGHNLAVLTEIVQRRAPGFTQLSWQLPLDAFERVLLGERAVAHAADLAGAFSPPPSPGAQQIGTEHSRPQSAEEVSREGHAYPGVFASFRTAFRNSGELVADLIILWRRENRLFFRVFDPSFSHTGEVFILRHQLFFVGEDDQRVDGLIYYLLNGVSGQKAFRIDGVLMTVANDRQRTPSAGPVVFQRLANLVDPGEPPPSETLAQIAERMRSALADGRIEAIAGPRVTEVVRPVVGAPQSDGLFDHLVRRPMDRSVGASEVELEDGVIADIERVRAAFLDDPSLHPMPLGFVFPRVS